ncbi:TadE/TadG family type IV pilus assembly protein [Nitratireductor sp. ZSWI3]|uniref:TadE/TadG family type IV pilus assembly protein n=1 Tax=Nitratireductor sp. ZSWI3 TaxID=2966359 RepID=UPI00214F9476|nr:TadE family protein [Nitratireductor sp. ZSWI3]MCR4264854.1 pilus assembly protein [Nitratireductor sp. ZSWI3]
MWGGERSPIRRLQTEENGAAMVEMSISIVLLLVLTLGFVDLGYAYYQWNAASSAVQVGARMASISDPLIDGVASAGNASPPVPGDPSLAYGFACTGGTDCKPVEFNRIFYGDDSDCTSAAGVRRGMCDVFPRLTPGNVEVSYTGSGLGYQTRPGGAVPTITVKLKGMTFQFFFLGGLLGFTNIAMPSMLSTVTGEDMKSTF